MKYTQPVRGSPTGSEMTTEYGTNWQELSGDKNGGSLCFAKCRKEGLE